MVTQWRANIVLTQVWNHFPTPFQASFLLFMAIKGKGLKLENTTEPPSSFQVSISLFSLNYSLPFLIAPSSTFSLANRPNLLAKACPIACSRRLWRTHAALTLLTSLHQTVWPEGFWILSCDSGGQRWHFLCPFWIYMCLSVPWLWGNNCFLGITHI